MVGMADQGSEIDGFGSVNTALKGFTEHQDTTMDSDELDRFIDTLSNTKEIADYYKTEMKQLQAEIESLEDKIEADEQRLLEIPANVLNEIKAHVGGASSIQPDEELHAIFKQLEMQVAFSKIIFTDATVKVIHQTKSKTITEHHLDGSCLGLNFTADFQVTETKVPKDETTAPILAGQETKAIITRLTATVDDRVTWELKEIVKEMETHCALEPFLNGYAQYAEWFRHREKTFSHFKKQYPETVTLPQGSSGALMQFSQSRHNGAVYIVSWTIPVNICGRTEPSIDLHVKASTHMNQIDEKNTLASVPEEFQKMITCLGVEKAIDSIIQAVIT